MGQLRGVSKLNHSAEINYLWQIITFGKTYSSEVPVISYLAESLSWNIVRLYKIAAEVSEVPNSRPSSFFKCSGEVLTSD